MAGLYSLVHVSDYGNKTIIGFKNNSVIRNKNVLTVIDSFTSDFYNDLSLSENLKYRGFKLEGGKYYIEYKSSGKTKKLDVIYSDMEVLKQFSKNNLGASKVKKNIDYTYYFYDLIENIKIDKCLFEYLKSYHYISQDLAQAISEYILYTKIGQNDCLSYTKSKINNYLTDYKTIRGIEIGKKKYIKRDKIKTDSKTLVKKKEKPEQLRLF